MNQLSVAGRSGSVTIALGWIASGAMGGWWWILPFDLPPANALQILDAAAHGITDICAK